MKSQSKGYLHPQQRLTAQERQTLLLFSPCPHVVPFHIPIFIFPCLSCTWGIKERPGLGEGKASRQVAGCQGDALQGWGLLWEAPGLYSYNGSGSGL